MRLFNVLCSIVLAAMVALIVVTLWATDRAIIRASCYRAAKHDCEPPRRIEQFLREWLP